jgi:hypothetical protein
MEESGLLGPAKAYEGLADFADALEKVKNAHQEVTGLARKSPAIAVVRPGICVLHELLRKWTSRC